MNAIQRADLNLAIEDFRLSYPDDNEVREMFMKRSHDAEFRKIGAIVNRERDPAMVSESRLVWDGYEQAIGFTPAMDEANDNR